MKRLVTIILLIAPTVSVFAQAKHTSTVKQIEIYARSIDRMADRQKEPDLVIADVSDYETDKPEWRIFGSTKELDAFREKTETYTVVYNWRAKGKIVASAFTTFSPSGDWAEYITHYFRPDSTAAKVKIEMRTFNGEYIIIREYYFDFRGKLLKKTAKYLDLTTKKPKKPTAEMLEESSGALRPDIFKNVNALPFFSLTRSR